MGLDQTLNVFPPDVDPNDAAYWKAREAADEAAYIARKKETGRWTTPEYEVLRWRKANQIHAWFNDRCEPAEGTTHGPGISDGEGRNCVYIPVPGEALIALLHRCREVLEDKTKAPSLLPSQEGFFFGGTEYDEWYFKDLEDTVDGLEKVLSDPAHRGQKFWYWAWW